jgi:hypothetical protein
MSPLGQDTAPRPGDAVAQRGEVKHLRIIRVKHFQAATGDELASAVASWFRAKKETTYTGTGDVVRETELSEQRELLDWRYQVTTAGTPVTNPDGTTTTSGELHHLMLFYAE